MAGVVGIAGIVAAHAESALSVLEYARRTCFAHGSAHSDATCAWSFMLDLSSALLAKALRQLARSAWLVMLLRLNNSLSRWRLSRFSLASLTSCPVRCLLFFLAICRTGCLPMAFAAVAAVLSFRTPGGRGGDSVGLVRDIVSEV